MLKGKRAIITGAAGDIGSEIARTYAEAGAFVALVDCDKEGLEKVGKTIQNSMTIVADLRAEKAIIEAVETAYGAHAKWDVLVNNAAIVKRGPLLEFSGDDWDEVLYTS